MKKLLEFLFFRWKTEIYARGKETWSRHDLLGECQRMNYQRDFIEYKMTNKFDGSIKIKRKYLN